MATTSTSQQTAPAPARREGPPRMGRATRRRVAWAAGGLALIAAIVGVLVLGPNKNPAPQHLSATPAQQPEQLVKAPLAEDARRVAVRFIQTAVARKNLDEAWTLVGPNLRGGLTKKRWTSGENPVVPYPVDKLDVAPYKVDASYTRSALLEVALLPRKGAGVRSQVFFLELKKLGSGPASRWVVDNWVPRAAAVVPR
jgi:hypothetical protein